MRTAVVQFFAAPRPQERLLSRTNSRKRRLLKRLGSDSTEQLANVDAIGGEGHIRNAALLVHPLTESRQQSRIVIGCPAQVDDPGISEMSQEQVDTMGHFLRPCMAVLLTLAPTQVALEPYQRLFVQLVPWRAVPVVPIYEVDEVFCRSEMPASRNSGVAGFR